MMKNITITLLFICFIFVEGYSQHLSPVKNSEGKYGFINESGDTVVPCQFDYADAFFDGMAAVRVNSKYGFINSDGLMAINPAFENAYFFSEGFCPVQKRNRWIYIDNSGRQVFDKNYLTAFPYSEALACVKTDKGWGFIGTDGNPVIDFVYESAWNFSEGLSNVKKNGLWGYIDRSGKVVIPFRYDEAFNFRDGKAYVAIDGSFFEIDKDGNNTGQNEDIFYEISAEAPDFLMDQDTLGKKEASEIWVMVEPMPEFPGGLDALFLFLSENLVYPQAEAENGKEGTVYVQFVVNQDGSISDITVSEGINENFNREAIRVVGMMPKWNPGVYMGKPTSVRMTLPVKFSLSK